MGQKASHQWQGGFFEEALSSARKQGVEHLVLMAQHNPNLKRFPLRKVASLGLGGRNPISLFEQTVIPVQLTTLVGRLFSGGQSLLFGDRASIMANENSSCPFCAAFGREAPDALRHFLLDCPMNQYHSNMLSDECEIHLLKPWEKHNIAASSKVKIYKNNLEDVVTVKTVDA